MILKLPDPLWVIKGVEKGGCLRKGRRASDEGRRRLEGVFPSKLTSDRPYRKGRSFEEAFGEVEKCAGTQFDPQLVEVALSIRKADWLEAKRNTLRRLRPPTIH